MKKTILTFLTLISLTAFSQSIIINPSDYYYVEAGELCSAHFDIVNNTDSIIDVVVTRTVPEEYLLIDSIMTYFCWGVTCYTPTTNTSTNPLTIAPGESPQIGFTGYIGNMPEESTYTINYCFSDILNPSNKVCTDVVFTSLSSYIGIEEPKANFEVYPNPANDILHLNYTAQKEANFVLYDMLGNQVYNDVVLNSKSIQLNAFEAGIYFYTFSVNGIATEVQKLIITH